MEVRKRLYSFEGPFSERCMEYIQLHRNLGYKFKIEETYLRQFDKFALDIAADGNYITKELFEEWTQKRNYESITTQRMRYQVLGRFCRYLHSIDNSSYVSFHPLKKATNSGFTPHIFTESEIKRFLDAADKMKMKSYSSNYHLIYPVIFRMLYACGIRISEALSLKVSDVDLKKGTLSIHGTKFHKSRLIPMSTSMTKVCRQYSEKVHMFATDDDFYFSSPYGGPYSESTIYTRFRTTLLNAGIPHEGRGKGPRLHDLRHTFAVHSLRRMSENGIDLYVGMPVLSGYLGHKDIFSTQKYLHLTAEMYPELVEKFDKSFGDVFPEVQYEET